MPVFSTTINRGLFLFGKRSEELEYFPATRAYVQDEPISHDGNFRFVTVGIGENSFEEKFSIDAFAIFGKRIPFFSEGRKKRSGIQLFVSSKETRHSETKIVEVDGFSFKRGVRIDPSPLVRHFRYRRPCSVASVVDAGLKTAPPPRMVNGAGMSDSGGVETEEFADRIRGFRKGAVAFLRYFERYATKSRAVLATVGEIERGSVPVIFSDIHKILLPTREWIVNILRYGRNGVIEKTAAGRTGFFLTP